MEAKSKHRKKQQQRNTFYSDHKGGLSTACSQAGWLNTAVQLYPDFP